MVANLQRGSGGVIMNYDTADREGVFGLVAGKRGFPWRLCIRFLGSYRCLQKQLTALRQQEYLGDIVFGIIFSQLLLSFIRAERTFSLASVTRLRTSIRIDVGFEILTVVTVNIIILQDVTSCSSLEFQRRFDRTYRLVLSAEEKDKSSSIGLKI